MGSTPTAAIADGRSVRRACVGQTGRLAPDARDRGEPAITDADQPDRRSDDSGDLRDPRLLVRVAAHEWRNLALVMEGHAALAERRADDPDAVRTHVRALRRALQHATRVAEDAGILAFDRAPATLERFAPADALAEACALALGFADERHRIEIDVAEDVRDRAVHGDRTLLVRAILNLLLNACEATDADGAVVVARLGYRDGSTERFELRVEDDGPGIDPEMRARLLASGTSSKGARRGLGFLVVRAAVDDLGGTLAIEPRSPQGTAIVLSFGTESTGH